MKHFIFFFTLLFSVHQLSAQLGIDGVSLSNLDAQTNPVVGTFVVTKPQVLSQNASLNKAELKFDINTGSIHNLYSKSLGGGDNNWSYGIHLKVELIDTEDGVSTVLHTGTVALSLGTNQAIQTALIDIDQYYEAVDEVRISLNNPINFAQSGIFNADPTAILSQIHLSAELLLDHRYDVKLGNTPIKISTSTFVVKPCEACVSSNEVSKVRFEWAKPLNTHFTHYDVQVYKLEAGLMSNGSDGFDFNDQIEWFRAPILEVEVSNTEDPFYEMTLAEGTGYYVWRVRLIGDYYPGGRSDFRNYGIWNEVDINASSLYTDGLSIFDRRADPAGNLVLNPLSTDAKPIDGGLFYYYQFNEAINWIYGKVLTEGSRQSETMTYANGLNQVQQSQTKLFSKEQVIAGQTVYDYSARPSFTTLPSPINDNKLGYKPDLLLNQTGDNFSAKDFDADPTIYPNGSPLGTSDQGTPNSYYSDQNQLGLMGDYVPDAKGFPYTRMLYYNDATGRVKQQSGPGEVMSLKDPTQDAESKNVLVYYADVSADELDRVFGSENPVADSGSVYKTINVDPNNVVSISYINKSGQVIATCLDGSDLDNLDNIGNEEVFTVSDKVLAGTFLQGSNVSVEDGTIVNPAPTPLVVLFNYNIRPSTFKRNLGLDANHEKISFCETCDYTIEVKITNTEKPEISYKMTGTLLHDLATTNEQIPNISGVPDVGYTCNEELVYTLNSPELNWKRDQIFVLNNDGVSISLPTGTYKIVKTIRVNNNVLTNNGEGKQSYLEAYTKHLSQNAEQWTAEHNYCGPFLLDVENEFPCGEVPDYCNEQSPSEFKQGTGFQTFTDLVYELVELEQSQTIGSGTNLYKDKMRNQGVGLLSNAYYGNQSSLATYLSSLESSVGCLSLSQCYTDAKSALEVNILLSEKGKETSDELEVNSDLITENEVFYNYSQDFDVLIEVLQCVAPASGFSASFFAGTDPTNRSQKKASAIVGVSNLSYGSGSPSNSLGNNNFSASYRGRLSITEAGNYTFKFTVDDGVRLYIDGQQQLMSNGIRDSWTNNSDVTFSSSQIHLTEGIHGIEVHYYEGGGAANLSLSWVHPTRGLELIPQTSVFQECQGYDALKIWHTNEPTNQDFSTLYLELPTSAEEDLSNDNQAAVKLGNLTAVMIHFTDNFINPANGEFVNGGLQDFDKKVASSLSDAITKTCKTAQLFNFNTGTSTGTDPIIGQIITACEEGCNSATHFDAAIDDFVTAANQHINAQGQYDLYLDESLQRDITDLDPGWLSFSDLFTDGNLSQGLSKRACYVMEMKGQCKDQCQMDYLENTETFSEDLTAAEKEILISQMINNQKAFEQAFLHGVEFKPVLTDLTIPVTSTLYQHAGSEEEVSTDIIAFVEESWKKAFQHRVYTNSLADNGFTQWEVMQHYPGSLNPTTTKVTQYSKTFGILINGEAKSIVVVANVVWDPGVSKLNLDDEFYEINFAIYDASISNRTFGNAKLRYSLALFNTLSSTNASIAHCDFPNFNALSFNVEQDLVKLAYAEGGYITATTNPNILCTDAYRTEIDLAHLQQVPTEALNVSRSQFSEVLTGSLTANTADEKADYLKLFLVKNIGADDELAVATAYVSTGYRNEKQALKVLAASINAKGLLYAQADITSVNPVLHLWRSDLAHISYKNRDNTYTVAAEGTVDFLTATNATVNTLNPVAINPLSISLATITTNNAEVVCPYGYIPLGGANPTSSKYHPSKFEAALEKHIEEVYFPFVYAEVKNAFIAEQTVDKTYTENIEGLDVKFNVLVTYDAATDGIKRVGLLTPEILDCVTGQVSVGFGPQFAYSLENLPGSSDKNDLDVKKHWFELRLGGGAHFIFREQASIGDLLAQGESKLLTTFSPSTAFKYIRPIVSTDRSAFIEMPITLVLNDGVGFDIHPYHRTAVFTMDIYQETTGAVELELYAQKNDHSTTDYNDNINKYARYVAVTDGSQGWQTVQFSLAEEVGAIRYEEVDQLSLLIDPLNKRGTSQPETFLLRDLKMDTKSEVNDFKPLVVIDKASNHTRFLSGELHHYGLKSYTIHDFEESYTSSLINSNTSSTPILGTELFCADITASSLAGISTCSPLHAASATFDNDNLVDEYLGLYQTTYGLQGEDVSFKNLNLEDRNYKLSASFEHDPSNTSLNTKSIDYDKGIKVALHAVYNNGTDKIVKSNIIKDAVAISSFTLDDEHLNGENIKSIYATFTASYRYWSPSESYVTGIHVRYNGITYKAKTMINANSATPDAFADWEAVVETNGTLPEWNVNTFYPATTSVQFNNQEYKARWYVNAQGTAPDVSNDWELILPQGVLPGWNVASVYTAGTHVHYNGNEYSAKNWVQGGLNPQDAGQWGAWLLVGTYTAPESRSADCFDCETISSQLFATVRITNFSLKTNDIDYDCAPVPDCALCMKWLNPFQETIVTEEVASIAFEDRIFEPCEEERQNYIDTREDDYLANCLEITTQNLADEYESSCMNKVDDQLSYSYNLGYHHYTLYYYDRAGNLTQTVPPEGVDFLTNPEVSALQVLRADDDLDNFTNDPVHQLSTRYVYNSIKQLVRQSTPDGHTTRFWYNAAGQLVLSQDAAQKDLGDYSYTSYDRLGRIIEVGELHGFVPAFLDFDGQSSQQASDDFQVIDQLWQSQDFPYNNVINCEQTSCRTSNTAVYVTEVHRTTYTRAVQGITCRGKVQTHLRNRISHVMRDPDGDFNTKGDQLHTYYSYDPHGNVEWLIQSLPEIGRKTIRYQYDLVSGNVNKVIYQENTQEQFMHRYDYDEDNRIILTETSIDGLVWNTEAHYDYYEHGPLARKEIGHDKIQGSDYVYTIEGYLKAINQPELSPTADPGHDGLADAGFLKDEFGMELGYYDGDYTRSNTGLGKQAIYDPYTTGGLTKSRNSLYNGNIAYWVSNTRAGQSTTKRKIDGIYQLPLHTYFYRYDKLNRIKNADFSTFENGAWQSKQAQEGQQMNEYDSKYSYDYNGNITHLARNGYVHNVDNGTTSLSMDNMVYAYNKAANGRLLNNKLRHITDLTINSRYGNDLESQVISNYNYDAEGNLIRDISEGLAISWNVLNKVKNIRKYEKGNTTVLLEDIRFEYDAMGIRVAKEEIINGKIEKGTYYVCDASGNVMAIYDKQYTVIGNSEKTEYRLKEYPIYGSDRVGLYRPENLVVATYDTYKDRFNTSIHNYSNTASARSRLLMATSKNLQVVDVLPDNVYKQYELYFDQKAWRGTAQWLDADNNIKIAAAYNLNNVLHIFNEKFSNYATLSLPTGLRYGKPFFLPHPSIENDYYLIYSEGTDFKYLQVSARVSDAPVIKQLNGSIAQVDLTGANLTDFTKITPVVYADGNSRIFLYRKDGDVGRIYTVDVTSEGFSTPYERYVIADNNFSQWQTEEMVFSPDGTKLAIANKENHVFVLDVDLATGALSHAVKYDNGLAGSQDFVKHIVFKDNHNLYYTTDISGKSLYALNLETGTSVPIKSRENRASQDLAMSVTGDVILIDDNLLQDPVNVQILTALSVSVFNAFPLQHYFSKDNLQTCDLNKTIQTELSTWLVPTEGQDNQGGLSWEFDAQGNVIENHQFDSEVSLGSNVAVAENQDNEEVLRFMVPDEVAICQIQTPAYANIQGDNFNPGLERRFYNISQQIDIWNKNWSDMGFAQDIDNSGGVNDDWDNNNLPAGTDAQSFAVRYEGWIEVPEDGDYTFYVKGAGFLAIDVMSPYNGANANYLMGSYWWNTGQERQKIFALSKGMHHIRMEYNYIQPVGSTVARDLSLKWSYGNVQKQLVPSAVLTHGQTTPSLPANAPLTINYKEHGLLAEYFQNTLSTAGYPEVARVEEQIDHVWNFYDKNLSQIAARYTGYLDMPANDGNPINIIIYTDHTFGTENVPQLWLNKQGVPLTRNSLLDKQMTFESVANQPATEIWQRAYEAVISPDLLTQRIPIRLEYNDANFHPVILRLAWNYQSATPVIIPSTYLSPTDTEGPCSGKGDQHGVLVNHIPLPVNNVIGSAVLNKGDRLEEGESLMAGEYRFTVNTDGTVAVYKGSVELKYWHTPHVNANDKHHVFITETGRMQMRNQYGNVIDDITNKLGSNKLVLYQDGQLLMMNDDVVYQTIYGHTLYNETEISSKGSQYVLGNRELDTWGFLGNENYHLKLSNSGNLFLYKPPYLNDKYEIWDNSVHISPRTATVLKMQDDGNLTIHTNGRVVRWKSFTFSSQRPVNYRFSLLPNGRISVIDENDNEVWGRQGSNSLGIFNAEAVNSLINANEVEQQLSPDILKSLMPTTTDGQVVEDLYNRSGLLSPKLGLGADYILSHYSTYVYLKEAGAYTFKEQADGMSGLYVNGELVMGEDVAGARQLGVASREVIYTATESGYYKLDFYRYHLTGDAVAQLLWKTPGVYQFKPIPSEVLYVKPPDAGQIYIGNKLVHNVAADANGTSVIVKASGNNDNYFVINTSKDEDNYHRVRRTKTNVKTGEVDSRSGFKSNSAIALAAYNDDRGEEYNKLFATLYSDGLTNINLMQYSVSEDGLSPDRVYNVQSEKCINGNCEAYPVTLGATSMQISPDGATMTLSYVTGNKSLGNINDLDVVANAFRIYDLEKQTGISLGNYEYYQVHTSAPLDVNSYAPRSSVDVLGFDYNQNADYIYYVQTNHITNTSSINRMLIADGTTSLLQVIPYVKKAAVRRAKGGKIYVSTVDNMYTVDGTSITSQTGNYTAGLPLQPYRVTSGKCETTAKPVQYATRTVGNRYYECKDHLGNVRVVLQDVRVYENMAAFTSVKTNVLSGEERLVGDVGGQQNLISVARIKTTAGSINPAAPVPFTAENTTTGTTIAVKADAVVSADVILFLGDELGLNAGDILPTDYLSKVLIKVCALQGNGNLDLNTVEYFRLSDVLPTATVGGNIAHITYSKEVFDGEVILFVTNINPTPIDVRQVVFRAEKDAYMGFATAVASWTDFYAFGMEMPGRSYSSSGYRYGFQGQEFDPETGYVNYKYRMYDRRSGRFFAVDPLAAKYPYNSTYAFSENRLIDGVELEGLEHRSLMPPLWGLDLFNAKKRVENSLDPKTKKLVSGAWNIAEGVAVITVTIVASGTTGGIALGMGGAVVLTYGITKVGLGMSQMIDASQDGIGVRSDNLHKSSNLSGFVAYQNPNISDETAKWIDLGSEFIPAVATGQIGWKAFRNTLKSSVSPVVKIVLITDSGMDFKEVLDASVIGLTVAGVKVDIKPSNLVQISPTYTVTESVVVKQGNTLSGLAKTHNTSVANLMKLNGIKEEDKHDLKIDQEIKIKQEEIK